MARITSSNNINLGESQGAEPSCVCVCNKRVIVRNTEPKACPLSTVHENLGICTIWRVHFFIVNCLLKNKFNIQ